MEQNGWIVIPKNFANYGTDYLIRPGIAFVGLGGIWPQDLVYHPTAFPGRRRQRTGCREALRVAL